MTNLSKVGFALIAAALVLSLSACSVNVIVAPHATLAVESDLSQGATQCATDGDVLVCSK